MEKNNQFFAMLSRMKYINRWGLMRNTMQENIAQHSLETAMIAHALVLIHNQHFCKDESERLSEERAAVLAMFHDTTEIITGDMPTPIKYFAPQIRDSYKKVEQVAAKQLLQTLPDELQPTYGSILLEQKEEKQLWCFVKAADKLSAYIKCLEETRVGNVDFEKAKQSTRKALDDMNMKEVDYFMEKFLPAYSLTLDEQADEERT